MKMKLFVIFVISAVLVSSFAASVLPYANALTQRTDFSDRHTTASWGNSHICGDHKCKPGEQSQWQMKLSAAQRGEAGSSAGLHGKGVMPTTGNIKMSDGMSMTDKGKTTPSNK